MLFDGGVKTGHVTKQNGFLFVQYPSSAQVRIEEPCKIKRVSHVNVQVLLALW